MISDEFYLCPRQEKNSRGLDIALITHPSTVLALAEHLPAGLGIYHEELSDQESKLVFTPDQYDIAIRAWSNAIQKQIKAKIFSSVASRIVLLPPFLSVLLKQITARANDLIKTPVPSCEQLLDPDLWKVLLPYQKEGINFVHQNEKRAYIADEMGIGKTLQGIAFGESLPEMLKLIICPSSLGSNWCKELNKWAKKKPEVLKLCTTGKEALSTLQFALDPSYKSRCKYEYVIISYSLLNSKSVQQWYTQIKPKDWYFPAVIVDESHYIKTAGSQRSFCTRNCCLEAKYVVLLSGTPAIVPSEMHTQLAAIHPELFGMDDMWTAPSGSSSWSRGQRGIPEYANEKKFQEDTQTTLYNYAKHIKPKISATFATRWCRPFLKRTYGTNFVWDLRGSARLQEFNAILKEVGVIRRLKKDVLKDLPKKSRHRVQITLGLQDQKRVDKAMEAYAKVPEDRPADKQKHWNHMYNDLPAMKLPFVCDYIISVVLPKLRADPAEAILIFAHHNELLDGIQECLRKEQVKILEKVGKEKTSRDNNEKEPPPSLECIMIRGGTNQKMRQGLVDRFQTAPNCRLALLGLTAAGVGLTLNRANVVIMAELHPTPANLLQAEDRAHRKGCKRAVNVYYLIAKDSLEDSMWRMIKRKEGISGEMLDGEKKSFDSLDREWAMLDPLPKSKSEVLEEKVDNSNHHGKRKKDEQTETDDVPTKKRKQSREKKEPGTLGKSQRFTDELPAPPKQKDGV